ncbi:MAG: L-glutamate gamma-semialdehyde dehydrogenase [Anaerolineae bacterium]|nr:L-glutamate gamma-semialdehyde dehydrogenase [Anaerolineae bacterium]
MLSEFRNEPNIDFKQEANITALRQALESVRAQFGKTYPMVIGDEKIELNDVFPSINPACPQEVLGYFPNGTADHADMAIEAATRAFESWQHTSVESRVETVLRVSAEIRRRRFEFCALLVLEAGKSWDEADGETCEAIDFIEYYARQMLRIADSSQLLGTSPGEHLHLQYIPLGVGAIIPPWNFPAAILTGLVAASLLAGNTVVLKPAEQTPLVGFIISELFWNAGLPAGVLNFVTGPGEIVGERMVQHPKTRFVAFTGSREVGIGIYEKASKVHAGQKWLKRSILEMGGKNAVIVDETADLDMAAQGIVTGAFSFQGQKCSAGSRAIIVDSVYDQLAAKVVKLAGNIKMGSPEQSPDNYMGPVIDNEAVAKINHYLEVGTHEGNLLLGGETLQDTSKGYFFKPTIFGEVAADAKVACDEIFGPVLALTRATDFDEALHIANNTEYGLTGSLYSRDSARLERAEREFHVGNLYFNRKCTGSMVSQNPFGGFGMSGTDSKAGGPDYMLLFTQAKSITVKA